MSWWSKIRDRFRPKPKPKPTPTPKPSPKPSGGNSGGSYQGPTRPGTDVKKFRKTGRSAPSSGGSSNRGGGSSGGSSHHGGSTHYNGSSGGSLGGRTVPYDFIGPLQPGVTREPAPTKRTVPYDFIGPLQPGVTREPAPSSEGGSSGGSSRGSTLQQRQTRPTPDIMGNVPTVDISKRYKTPEQQQENIRKNTQERYDKKMQEQYAQQQRLINQGKISVDEANKFIKDYSNALQSDLSRSSKDKYNNWLEKNMSKEAKEYYNKKYSTETWSEKIQREKLYNLKKTKEKKQNEWQQKFNKIREPNNNIPLDNTQISYIPSLNLQVSDDLLSAPIGVGVKPEVLYNNLTKKQEIKTYKDMGFTKDESRLLAASSPEGGQFSKETARRLIKERKDELSKGPQPLTWGLPTKEKEFRLLPYVPLTFGERVKNLPSDIKKTAREWGERQNRIISAEEFLGLGQVGSVNEKDVFGFSQVSGRLKTANKLEENMEKTNKEINDLTRGRINLKGEFVGTDNQYKKLKDLYNKQTKDISNYENITNIEVGGVKRNIYEWEGLNKNPLSGVSAGVNLIGAGIGGDVGVGAGRTYKFFGAPPKKAKYARELTGRFVESGISAGKYFVPGGMTFMGIEAGGLGVDIGQNVAKGKKVTKQQKTESLWTAGTLLTMGLLKGVPKLFGAEKGIVTGAKKVKGLKTTMYGLGAGMGVGMGVTSGVQTYKQTGSKASAWGAGLGTMTGMLVPTFGPMGVRKFKGWKEALGTETIEMPKMTDRPFIRKTKGGVKQAVFMKRYEGFKFKEPKSWKRTLKGYKKGQFVKRQYRLIDPLVEAHMKGKDVLTYNKIVNGKIVKVTEPTTPFPYDVKTEAPNWFESQKSGVQQYYLPKKYFPSVSKKAGFGYSATTGKFIETPELQKYQTYYSGKGISGYFWRTGGERSLQIGGTTPEGTPRTYASYFEGMRVNPAKKEITVPNPLDSSKKAKGWKQYVLTNKPIPGVLDMPVYKQEMEGVITGKRTSLGTKYSINFMGDKILFEHGVYKNDLLGDFFGKEKGLIKNKIKNKNIGVKSDYVFGRSYFPSPKIPLISSYKPSKYSVTSGLYESSKPSKISRYSRISKPSKYYEPSKLYESSKPSKISRYSRISKPSKSSKPYKSYNFYSPHKPPKPFESYLYEPNFRRKKAKPKKPSKEIIKKRRKYVAQITAFEAALGLGPRYVKAGEKFTGFEALRGRAVKPRKKSTSKKKVQKRDKLSRMLY